MVGYQSWDPGDPQHRETGWDALVVDSDRRLDLAGRHAPVWGCAWCHRDLGAVELCAACGDTEEMEAA